MKPNKALLGKRLLIVDDESDILETLIDLLETARIDCASSFEEAKQQLEEHEYDLVVLDIMGVRGFDLLKIASRRKIPALMLTAHSLSEESLRRSVEEGAAYFVPKEKMADIATYAADVLEAQESGKNPWTRWFDRLAGFFDDRFSGPNWREQEKKFVERITKNAI